MWSVGVWQMAAAGDVPVGGFNPFMIIMMLGMLGLLFFMQSRAKKQAAQRDAFRTTLAPGQRVMTQGGLVGTIVAINEASDTVILDSAGSRCEYMRAGIAKTLDDAAPAVGLAAVGQVPAVPAQPLYGANPQVGAAPQYGANPAAPAAGGFLANALGNLAGTANAGPAVTDDDLAELDSISREYYESRENTVAAGPVVIEEDGI